MDNEKLSRKKPRSRFWKFFTVVLLATLTMGVGYAAHLYATTKSAFDSTTKGSKETAQVDLSKQKPISFLLLGTDTGELGRTEKGRTDSIILVTVNPKKKRTTMISIPRDTLARIETPDFTDGSKINAAYSFGGVDATISTVKKLLNVPVNSYVLVNMGGLEQIVDAVGGVDINVPFSFSDRYIGNYTFTKGMMHMNGKQALAYARMRHADAEGDYGRQKRQQQVIQAIVKSALSANTLGNYKKLMNSMKNNLQTDLSFDRITQIATNYGGAAKKINSTTVQGQGTWVGDGAYEIPSTEELQAKSDLARSELGLEKMPLNNYNTFQNQQNMANGYQFNGATQNYTLFPYSGN